MNRLFAFLLLLFFTHFLQAQNDRRFMMDNKLFPPRFLKKNRVGVTPVLKHAHFQPGDTVLDVGAANGWFACALAMHQSNLTFYLEDIDSAALRPERQTMAVEYYSRLNEKTLDSHFLPILGSETQIPLPDQSVHKILLIDTYHHFSKRPEMLREMHRILKKDGKLLVLEVLANHPGDIHPGCHSLLHQKPALLKDFTDHGFHSVENARAGRELRRQKQLFVFRKM